MVYSNGWNPAYTFDDMGGAVLAAAAAAAGLQKLAITGAASAPGPGAVKGICFQRLSSFRPIRSSRMSIELWS